ncbi:MAG TPA: type II toxin-antitoxin system HicA family toxin [Candidatus Nanoarchaeia archaeon]|nr:type II toxin-antitoxin system HicA family toxin [Candidatus Nanoarchaeia archaeon]
MAKLPQINAIKLIKILGKIGFEVIRQEGSHVFLRHKDGRTTVIPNHPGEKIDRGLLNKILKKDIQISREDFDKLF